MKRCEIGVKMAILIKHFQQLSTLHQGTIQISNILPNLITWRKSIVYQDEIVPLTLDDSPTWKC